MKPAFIVGNDFTENGSSYQRYFCISYTDGNVISYTAPAVVYNNRSTLVDNDYITITTTGGWASTVTYHKKALKTSVGGNAGVPQEIPAGTVETMPYNTQALIIFEDDSAELNA